MQVSAPSSAAPPTTGGLVAVRVPAPVTRVIVKQGRAFIQKKLDPQNQKEELAKKGFEDDLNDQGIDTPGFLELAFQYLVLSKDGTAVQIEKMWLRDP